jgi:hypothetical protein
MRWPVPLCVTEHELPALRDRHGDRHGDVLQERIGMTTQLGEQRTCAAVTRVGAPCRMRPLLDSAFCFNHAPERGRERAAARQQGGWNRRTPPGTPPPDTSVRSFEAVLRQLKAVLHATWQQENSHRRSLALASLLGLALKVLEQPARLDPIWELNEQVFGGHRRS